MKHSPLPWKDDCLVRCYILDADDNLVCACSSHGTARFIYLACNHFDKMRGLLDAYTRALPDERELAPIDICANGLLAKLEEADV